MLSAVAARKAAQASLQKPSKTVPKPSPLPPTPSTPASSEDEVAPPIKPVSKRKSSSATPKKGKKKLKVRHGNERRPRYFVGEEQPDDVVRSETEGDAMIIDGLDSDVDDLAAPQETSTSRPFVSRTGTKKAWSPSVPLQDSSDEDAGEVEESELPDVPPAVAQPNARAPDALTLSNFHPIPSQNIFSLSLDELRDLHLSESTKTETATVFILRLGESLALLGTYTFTLLQGSLSLCGVTLAASRTSYDVFAPRSAPIPVLRCVASESSEFPFSLPPRIGNEKGGGDAIVVIRELRTGVEGLGRVCKTFDDVFSPSGWQQGEEPNQGLNLTGVHLVGCFSCITCLPIVTTDIS
jgi:polynucleotide 5'-hydroxyl-kinase GRC3/NOL9